MQSRSALEPGDTANSADIEVPLGAIHSIAGNIAQGETNQPVSRARIHLLYADDREEALVMDMFADGSFLLPFVPKGSYLIQVTDASWTEPATPTGSTSTPAPKTHPLRVRELPVTVDQDVSALHIGLVELPGPAQAGANEKPAAPSPQ